MTKLAKSHYKSLLLWKRMANELGLFRTMIDLTNGVELVIDPRIKVKQLYTRIHYLYLYLLLKMVLQMPRKIADAQEAGLLAGPSSGFVAERFSLASFRSSLHTESTPAGGHDYLLANNLPTSIVDWPQIQTEESLKLRNELVADLKLPDANYELITVDRTLRTWPVNADTEPYLSDMVGQFMVNDFIVFDKDDNRVLPTDIPHMLKPDTMVECLFKLQYHHINGTHSFTMFLDQTPWNQVFSKVPWCPRLYQPLKCEAGIMFNPYVQARFPCFKCYNTAAGQHEHSGLFSVRLPTLAVEEEYWSTLIANHAQTMGNQRVRLGQRKEAQRWTVIQWFNQADWTPYIQYELILV
ncbi:hypothetical protein DFH08DRAFT_817095 [Mycena albidolilacea]|uniref:Uncharacterized protein n=1 Tax=Mycena albidolilacea TaxID=1033008 RepID=A0AAD7EIK0_9AGAR|nr:hypothetical protein DFH08DRAFT_817095 [Mycena albidolilacea]